MAKAEARTACEAFTKLTQEVDGELRIVSDPPLIVPIWELVPQNAARGGPGRVGRRLRRINYRGPLCHQHRRRRLTATASSTSPASVVGVGQHRDLICWIVLMLRQRLLNDPLFLQVKEAQPLGARAPLRAAAAAAQEPAGRPRIIAADAGGQRDIFLGLVSPTRRDRRRAATTSRLARLAGTGQTARLGSRHG